MAGARGQHRPEHDAFTRSVQGASKSREVDIVSRRQAELGVALPSEFRPGSDMVNKPGQDPAVPCLRGGARSSAGPASLRVEWLVGFWVARPDPRLRGEQIRECANL